MSLSIQGADNSNNLHPASLKLLQVLVAPPNLFNQPFNEHTFYFFIQSLTKTLSSTKPNIIFLEELLFSSPPFLENSSKII